MAVLGRVRWTPNMRVDLPDVVALDAYNVTDWQFFMSSFVGTGAYIVKGFEVFNPGSLIGNPATAASIVVDNSMVWSTKNDTGSFFSPPAGTSNIAVPLLLNTVNYVEMELVLDATAEDTRGIWDPSANGGRGSEFTQVVQTETFLTVNVTRNNTGFSSNKIPLATITVVGGNVTAVEDNRPMMFRLGRGGALPDPNFLYNWESDPSGFARTDVPSPMQSPTDPNVFRGSDKNIENFKEWMDAVMSRIAEIAGTTRWFGPNPASSNISLQTLFLDSDAGHSVEATRNVQWTWSKNADNILKVTNPFGVDESAKWRLNGGFARIRWELGQSFQAGTRRYTVTSPFQSPALADGQNLYLKLQREALINPNPVTFTNGGSGITRVSATPINQFTGIAVGDYVRRESDTPDGYLRVVEVRVDIATPFPNGTIEGTVADASVKMLVLEAPAVNPLVNSTERYRFFRSRYSAADVFASDTGFYDTLYYWLGRRVGANFQMRHHGLMTPGEQWFHGEDSALAELAGSENLSFDLNHATVYSSGTISTSSAVAPLLTIRRRKSENTSGTPTPDTNNTDALLEYTVSAATVIAGLTPGFKLWARLRDSVDGALTSGSVTGIAPPANVFEVLADANSPLKTQDTKDVFLLAWPVVVVGPGPVSFSAVQFADGTLFYEQGRLINSNTAIGGNFVPSQDNLFDLGSSLYRFQDLYLGPNSLRILETANANELLTRRLYGRITGGVSVIESLDGTGSPNPQLQLRTGANIGLFMDSTGRIGHNKLTPTALLDILGKADEATVRIRPFASQSLANALEIQDTTGMNQFRVQPSGIVNVRNSVEAEPISEGGTGILRIGETAFTNTVRIGCGTAVQTINVGTGAGQTIINIGASGDIVNINGTVAFIQSVNATIKAKINVLNAGGTAGSGSSSGLWIQEASLTSLAATNAIWQTQTTVRYAMASTTGLVVGDNVTISGFVSGSGINNGTFEVIALLANNWIEVSNTARTSGTNDETVTGSVTVPQKDPLAVGYGSILTSADRNSWELKAPNRRGFFRFTPDDSGVGNNFTVTFNTAALTANRTITVPNESFTLVGSAVAFPATRVLLGNGSFAIASSANFTWSSLNNQMLTSDGTVGSPVWSFLAAPSTGLFRDGSGRFAFAHTGVQIGDYSASSAWFLGSRSGATTDAHRIQIEEAGQSVVRFRNRNNITRVTRIQLEDYTGAIADGLLSLNALTGTLSSSYVSVEIGGGGAYRIYGSGTHEWRNQSNVVVGTALATGDWNIGRDGASNTTIQGYARQASNTSVASGAGNETFNCALQNLFTKTGGSGTITFTNMTENQTVNLVMLSTGSAYTLTFGGYTFRWGSGGNQPIPTTTAGRRDVYTFIRIGGEVYGAAILNYA